MSDLPIAIGDIVTLKSGGPAMTVQGIVEPAPADKGLQHGFPTDKQVRVVWFDVTGNAQERVFWPHLLVGKGTGAGPAETDAERQAALREAAKAKAETDRKAAYEHAQA